MSDLALDLADNSEASGISYRIDYLIAEERTIDYLIDSLI